jgi:hypothetical protein
LPALKRGIFLIYFLSIFQNPFNFHLYTKEAFSYSIARV